MLRDLNTLPKYLRPEEFAALKLRELYSDYGYSFYRMGKFEEYDLYAKNKEFLISQDIITFTDIDGKLMALKPDVTLSIVKHLRENPENVLQKFFYDEKIYRTSRNIRAFREISQVGLECIGAFDEACVREVLELALKSLEKISDGKEYVLDVSHLGLLSSLLSRIDNTNLRADILKFVSEKNSHEIANLQIPELEKNLLVKLINVSGISELREIFRGNYYLAQFENLLGNFGGNVRVDFSVISDLNYYNGIVFRGFIDGVPESILSGGQYDNLMRRMGHENSHAIGFAVYLDKLDKLGGNHESY